MSVAREEFCSFVYTYKQVIANLSHFELLPEL